MCSTLLLSYMPGAFSPGHGCQGGHSWLQTFLNMISISLMRAWLCSGFTMSLLFQLDVVTLSSLCADIHERCHQGQSGQYLGVGGGNAYPHGHRFWWFMANINIWYMRFSRATLCIFKGYTMVPTMTNSEIFLTTSLQTWQGTHLRSGLSHFLNQCTLWVCHPIWIGSVLLMYFVS